MGKDNKTTIFGIISSIGAGLTLVPTPIIHTIGVILTAIGTFGLGKSASDSK